MDCKITDRCYWVCVYTETQKQQLIEYNMKNDVMYINHRELIQYSDGDILFYCSRRYKRCPTCVFGYCKLKNTLVKNIKVNIFDTVSENKYCSNIDEFTIFKNPIPITIFFGRKSSMSFIGTFLKCDLLVKKLSPIHGELINAIVVKYKSETIANDILEQEIDREINKKKSINTTKTRKTKEKIVIVDNDTDDINSDSDKSSVCSQNTKCSDDDIVLNSTDTNSNDSGNSVSDDPDNLNGSVPILVETCSKFKFPVVKFDTTKFTKSKNPDVNEKCKYFIKHIKKCCDCNITNNNSYDLVHIFDDMQFTYVKYELENGVLEEIIDKYQNALKFDVVGCDVDKNISQIIHVLDEDNLYRNCLFICTTFAIE